MTDKTTDSMLEIEMERFLGGRPPEAAPKPTLAMRAGVIAFTALVMPGIAAIMFAIVPLVTSLRTWLDTAQWVWVTNRDALLYAGQTIPWSNRKGEELILELMLNTPFAVTLVIAGALWALVLPLALFKLGLAVVDAIGWRGKPTNA